jgi:hypothetical protein
MLKYQTKKYFFWGICAIMSLMGEIGFKGRNFEGFPSGTEIPKTIL